MSIWLVLILLAASCSRGSEAIDGRAATATTTTASLGLAPELGNPLLDAASCPTTAEVVYVFAQVDNAGPQVALQAAQALAGRLSVAGLKDGCVRTSGNHVQVVLAEDNTIMNDDEALIARNMIFAATSMGESCEVAEGPATSGSIVRDDANKCFRLDGSGVVLDDALVQAFAQRDGTSGSFVVALEFASDTAGQEAIESELALAATSGGVLAIVRGSRVIVAPTASTSTVSEGLRISVDDARYAAELAAELSPMPAIQLQAVQRVTE